MKKINSLLKHQNDLPKYILYYKDKFEYNMADDSWSLQQLIKNVNLRHDEKNFNKSVIEKGNDKSESLCSSDFNNGYVVLNLSLKSAGMFYYI